MHPVHDVYLEELLRMIDYQPQGTFLQRAARPADAPSLPHALAEQLDTAIYNGLLSSEPRALDELFEVLPSRMSRRDLT